MRLVDDERVVLTQHPVVLDLGQQDAVGHQLDQGVVTGGVGEADLVADRLPQGGADLVGDAFGDRAGGEPARLGVADGAHDAATQLHADLGQLGGLTRTRLTGDDDDLVVADGRGNVVALGADREFFGIGEFGDGLTA